MVAEEAIEKQEKKEKQEKQETAMKKLQAANRPKPKARPVPPPLPKPQPKPQAAVAVNVLPAKHFKGVVWWGGKKEARFELIIVLLSFN